MYHQYIKLLSSLDQRTWSKQEIEAIEQKLDELNLFQPTEKRIKYLKKKYQELINYLKQEFSLITVGYYMNLGLVFGMIFGMALGISFGTAFGEVQELPLAYPLAMEQGCVLVL